MARTPNRCAREDMKRREIEFKSQFAVLLSKGECQFTEMVLKRGGVEGGPDNRHRMADQWLFVVSGKGVAIVNGRRHLLRKWSMLLIEKGDAHEIRNTGTTPLRTLNTYSPPAYTRDGDVLPAGMP